MVEVACLCCLTCSCFSEYRYPSAIGMKVRSIDDTWSNLERAGGMDVMEPDPIQQIKVEVDQKASLR